MVEWGGHHGGWGGFGPPSYIVKKCPARGRKSGTKFAPFEWRKSKVASFASPSRSETRSRSRSPSEPPQWARELLKNQEEYRKKLNVYKAKSSVYVDAGWASIETCLQICGEQKTIRDYSQKQLILEESGQPWVLFCVLFGECNERRWKWLVRGTIACKGHNSL